MQSSYRVLVEISDPIEQIQYYETLLDVFYQRRAPLGNEVQEMKAVECRDE